MRRTACLLFAVALLLGTAGSGIARADVVDDNPATASRGSGDAWVFARADNGEILERHWTGERWTDWATLGGNMSSGPAAAGYGGSIHVFARGQDNAVYWNQLNSDGWSGWRYVGGYTTSAPAVNARRSENALDLVVKGGDDQLYHQAYTPATGWSGFGPLGGTLTSAASVNSQAPGYLNIWARGTDGQVYQRSWTAASGWVDWSTIGGGIVGAPTSVSRQDGVIDVFARGAGDALYQRTWTSAGSWGAWTLIDSTPLSSSPAAAAEGPGREWLFARRFSGIIYKVWTPTKGWTGWEQFGGSARLPDKPVPPSTPTTTTSPGQSELDLTTGLACTPAGGKLRVSVSVRKPKGKAKPRVTKIVFFTKGKGRKVRTDRKAPFEVNIAINRPAGSTGRVYARVYYKRSARGKTSRKLVSRRYKVCR